MPFLPGISTQIENEREVGRMTGHIIHEVSKRMRRKVSTMNVTKAAYVAFG